MTKIKLGLIWLDPLARSAEFSVLILYLVMAPMFFRNIMGTGMQYEALLYMEIASALIVLITLILVIISFRFSGILPKVSKIFVLLLLAISLGEIFIALLFTIESYKFAGYPFSASIILRNSAISAFLVIVWIIHALILRAKSTLGTLFDIYCSKALALVAALANSQVYMQLLFEPTAPLILMGVSLGVVTPERLFRAIIEKHTANNLEKKILECLGSSNSFCIELSTYIKYLLSMYNFDLKFLEPCYCDIYKFGDTLIEKQNDMVLNKLTVCTGKKPVVLGKKYVLKISAPHDAVRKVLAFLRKKLASIQMLSQLTNLPPIVVKKIILTETPNYVVLGDKIVRISDVHVRL